MIKMSKSYIVFDLEATCEENDRQFPNEIIEIGAVKVKETAEGKMEVVDEFVTFARPQIRTQLTSFCKNLTTITQEQVDTAPSFKEAVEAFKTWIGMDDEYLLCSWGHYDRNQFKKDLRKIRANDEWVEQHISLKHQYADITGKFTGLKGALREEKLKLEGTHHRGIDDARNIAKIFIKYFDKWTMEPQHTR